MPVLNFPPPSDAVDQTIAGTDEMFERHAPPEEAWAHYFACGRSALRAVQLALAAAGVKDVRRILDLPCGHGRVLRTLRAAYPAAEIHVSDLNRDGVEFCAARFGAKPIEAHPNPRDVRLPGGYDLIWVGSLMTHLDSARWSAFLTLFRGALAPGGVCVFTTHGRHAVDLIRTGTAGYGLKDPAALLRPYRRTGFAYAAYPGQDYGISLSNPEWVYKQLSAVPDTRVVMFTERGWADHQDVFAFAAPAANP